MVSLVVSQPSSHTIALNLIHAHECVAAWGSALACAMDHLRRNAACRVGTVSNAHILTVLERVRAMSWHWCIGRCAVCSAGSSTVTCSCACRQQVGDVAVYQQLRSVDVASIAATLEPLSVEWRPLDPPYARVTHASTGVRALFPALLSMMPLELCCVAFPFFIQFRGFLRGHQVTLVCCLFRILQESPRQNRPRLPSRCQPMILTWSPSGSRP